MEEFNKVLIVVNPIAGDIDKDELLPKIEKAIHDNNAEAFIFKTTGKNDSEKLQSKIKETQPDRIISVGGDGTIKLAAQAIINLDIPLGIIPAGSANGLALNLKLPTNLKDQLAVALGSQSRSLDVLQIDDEICLHLADLGINAELIRNYESSKIRGKFGYLLQSVPTLIRSKYPFTFEIYTAEKEIQHRGILLAFANFNKYGTGANINPQGKPDDGVFEIVIFKNFDLFEIMNTLRNEQQLNPEFAEIISTREAKITCTKPVAFQIDGEYLGEREEISVKIKAKKLRIVS